MFIMILIEFSFSFIFVLYFLQKLNTANKKITDGFDVKGAMLWRRSRLFLVSLSHNRHNNINLHIILVDTIYICIDVHHVAPTLVEWCMCQASSTAVARLPNNWEIAGRCLHVVQAYSPHPIHDSRPASSDKPSSRTKSVIFSVRTIMYW